MDQQPNDQQQTFKAGALIDGRYEVVRCLGAGSMGSVYACRHQDLSGSLVAVKVLFPEVARDRVSAARFKNEILASYKVSHPNVVRAFEFIKDGDLIAYSMEYVGGGDVADKLGNPDRPLPINEIIRILSEMCLGVQAIHDAGIVHRDLKPENILLSDTGQVKIADFGIAKAGGGPKLTEHGGVVGTLDYVSPEYMLNAQVDWRSDIYAIGVLAYEMVAGEAPFKGESVYATMTKRLKSDPEPPSKLRSGSPVDLDKIIIKAMQRDPELRYQSAAAMYRDLQSLARNLGLDTINNSVGAEVEERSGEAGKPMAAPTRPARERSNIKLVSDLPSTPPVEEELDSPTVGFGTQEDRVSESVRSSLTPSPEEETASFAIQSGKLEPLLQPRPAVSPRPSPPPKGQSRRLTSDFPTPPRKSRWSLKDTVFMDAGILILAVIIGVGAGLLALKLVAPHLLTH